MEVHENLRGDSAMAFLFLHMRLKKIGLAYRAMMRTFEKAVMLKSS